MSRNSVSFASPSSWLSLTERKVLLGLYVSALTAATAGLAVGLALGYTSLDLPRFSIWEFSFFFVLALLAEKATIRVGRGMEVTPSLISYFLAIAVLGPLAALAVAFLAQMLHVRRRQWTRNLCFVTTAALQAGIAGIVYWSFPSAWGATPSVLVLGGIVTGVAYQLINYVLFAPVTVLRAVYGPISLWKKGIQPFLPYHLFFLAVSLGLVWIFNRTESLVASVLLLLPVLGLIFSFRAYSALTQQAEENRLLALRNERLAMQAVAALVNALDARDHYTSKHSGAVAQWATAIAKEMGLDRRQVELTHLAGLMHDVGKIWVPDEILKGSGPLSQWGRDQICQHPARGRDILAAIDDLSDVAEVVLYHHERYDGSGYPFGVARDSIPLVSRIIGVVDAYSAMMMDRPYRPQLPLEVAKMQLLQNRGTQFDPVVVDVFLGLLEQANESYQRGEEADFDVEFQKVKYMRELHPGNG